MRAARYDAVAAVLEKADAQARTPPATRLALRLLVLTASRTREIRLMEWADVDLDAAVWTRPADKMKECAPVRNRWHQVRGSPP